MPGSGDLCCGIFIPGGAPFTVLRVLLSLLGGRMQWLLLFGASWAQCGAGEAGTGEASEGMVSSKSPHGQLGAAELVGWEPWGHALGHPCGSRSLRLSGVVRGWTRR